MTLRLARKEKPAPMKQAPTGKSAAVKAAVEHGTRPVRPDAVRAAVEHGTPVKEAIPRARPVPKGQGQAQAPANEPAAATAKAAAAPAAGEPAAGEPAAKEPAARPPEGILQPEPAARKPSGSIVKLTPKKEEEPAPAGLAPEKRREVPVVRRTHAGGSRRRLRRHMAAIRAMAGIAMIIAFLLLATAILLAFMHTTDEDAAGGVSELLGGDLDRTVHVPVGGADEDVDNTPPPAPEVTPRHMALLENARDFARRYPEQTESIRALYTTTILFADEEYHDAIRQEMKARTSGYTQAESDD